MQTPEPSAANARNYTSEIIHNIAPGYSTRKDAALDYAWGLIYHFEEIDWPKVNAAIIERWSVAGLEWIKSKAWKIKEAESHG